MILINVLTVYDNENEYTGFAAVRRECAYGESIACQLLIDTIAITTQKG